jgi:hypothetical protein
MDAGSVTNTTGARSAPTLQATRDVDTLGVRRVALICTYFACQSADTNCFCISAELLTAARRKKKS